MKTRLLREARRCVQVRRYTTNDAMVKIEYPKETVYFQYRGPIGKLEDRAKDYILKVAREIDAQPSPWEIIKEKMRGLIETLMCPGYIIERLMIISAYAVFVFGIAFLTYLAFHPETATDWKGTHVIPFFFFR